MAKSLKRRADEFLQHEFPEWVFWCFLGTLTTIVVLLNVFGSKWVGIGACLVYIAILGPIAVYGLRHR